MLDLNISFTLSILTIARAGRPTPTGQPRKLSIPWQEELQEVSDVTSLLSWRTCLSNFVGFDDQMDELRGWAMSVPQVSLKFMVGEGGTGKTRGAAEFARSLQCQEKWAAGFVDLRKPQSYGLSRKGNLLLVDYPEEQESAVAELLKDLVGLGSDCPRLRVLLMTRRSIDHWYDVVTDSKANTVVDMRPVLMQGLGPADAYKAFCSAQNRAAKHRKTTPVPVSEEQLADWLKLTPENDRALFVVAAAVHSAVKPNDLVVQYSGSEVVQSIAEREVAGLRNIAKGAGLKDEYALARILSLAAIAGSISEEEAVNVARDRPDLIGPDAGQDIRKALRITWPGRLVPAPKPDILAAAMLVRTLSETPATAPELIWLGIAPDILNGLNRIARLSYDAEIVLGMHQHRISDWLAEAVQGRKERCEILEPYFCEDPMPICWINAAVAMSRTLLDSVVTEEDTAEILNNLSIHLCAAGDNEGALQAIREGVQILRLLAAAHPARYEPDLAVSLNNLSHFLSDAGDNEGALQASHEAVDIFHRLAEGHPARYEPGLAMSLNNLSNVLSAAGDNGGAIEPIGQAVAVYRRLARVLPARYEPDLAMSLNNLANRLRATGDNAGALKAIREAVAIRRRLAEGQPAKYDPDLATSLANLGRVLRKSGQSEIGNAALEEAAELLRPYALQLPDSRHMERLRYIESILKS
jgi:tetratricopeptide (TPR) repeat protein